MKTRFAAIMLKLYPLTLCSYVNSRVTKPSSGQLVGCYLLERTGSSCYDHNSNFRRGGKIIEDLLPTNKSVVAVDSVGQYTASAKTSRDETRDFAWHENIMLLVCHKPFETRVTIKNG